jgi:hypothetical protein
MRTQAQDSRLHSPRPYKYHSNVGVKFRFPSVLHLYISEADLGVHMDTCMQGHSSRTL